jgi:hypothetical protein
LLLSLARKFFLKTAAAMTTGKTIDFGCGVGELLSLLEPGSIGFEINPCCVDLCKGKGLNVHLYEPAKDKYQLQTLSAEDGFKTMIMSHVLEHLEKPIEVLDGLLSSCERLKIEKVILLIPDLKGFKKDSTHKVFISEANLPRQIGKFRLVFARHFPFNALFLQKNFTNNELRVVYKRTE